MGDWSDLLKFTPLVVLVLLSWAKSRRRRQAREGSGDPAAAGEPRRPDPTRTDETEFRREYEPIEPR